MRDLILLLNSLFVILGISHSGFCQGFYIKPTFSYGAALNKQEIAYLGVAGTYVQSSNYETVEDNYVTVVNTNEKHIEKVPLGKGKVFSLELGYESKKYLFYTLGFTLGLMDRYTSSNFYHNTMTIKNSSFAQYAEGNGEYQQIVSPIWYGIEPGIGVYKVLGKFKISASVTVFVGKCRIRVIQDTKENGMIQDDNGTKYSFSNTLRNDVLCGSFMYGGSLSASLERSISSKSAVQFLVSYRSQIYSPSQAQRKDINNYYHFMGSVIPYSIDKDPQKNDIPKEARMGYLFESFSCGIAWKRYFRKNN